jgi:DNA invertase Pin-like site-specific DNA recombinase
VHANSDIDMAREDIHCDVASGAKASRPKLDLVLQLLRAGDTLVITRLDRLGRSVLHLVTLGAQLGEREVGLKATEQGHRHRHRRGAGDVRDALGPGRAAARADRGQHP